MSWLALAVSAAFNLQCLGTETALSRSDQLVDQSFEREYRIDLDQRRWCDRACDVTRPFSRVEPTMLVLEDRDGVVTTELNRETGELSIVDVAADGGVSTVLAQCEVRPFSGFPRVKF